MTGHEYMRQVRQIELRIRRLTLQIEELESGLLHRQHMECNMAFIAELEKEWQNNGKKEG